MNQGEHIDCSTRITRYRRATDGAARIALQATHCAQHSAVSRRSGQGALNLLPKEIAPWQDVVERLDRREA